jgi:uncharacterized protein YtpQ (UPF0354 family)
MESKAKTRGGARKNAGRKTKHNGEITTIKVEKEKKEVVEKMRDMFYKYEKLEDEAVDKIIEMLESSGILEKKYS